MYGWELATVEPTKETGGQERERRTIVAGSQQNENESSKNKGVRSIRATQDLELPCLNSGAHRVLGKLARTLAIG